MIFHELRGEKHRLKRGLFQVKRYIIINVRASYKKRYEIFGWYKTVLKVMSQILDRGVMDHECFCEVGLYSRKWTDFSFGLSLVYVTLINVKKNRI